MARGKVNSPLDLRHLPAVIQSVRTPVGFASLCVVILALGALSLAAWMSPENQRLLIIAVMGILLLVILGIFGLAFFRPEALRDDIDSVAHANANEIRSCALNEALRIAFERNRRIDVLRVFALTSGQITPLLYELIDGVYVGELRMILFDPSSSKALPEKTVEKIKQNYEGITHYLDQIRKKIRKLDLKFQPFCPTEYYVIIDNREIILAIIYFKKNLRNGILRGNGGCYGRRSYQSDLPRH